MPSTDKQILRAVFAATNRAHCTLSGRDFPQCFEIRPHNTISRRRIDVMVGSFSQNPIFGQHVVLADFLRAAFDKKASIKHEVEPQKHDQPPWGGTDLERGYGDVQPWRPPFHASPVVHKGPISSNSLVQKLPFWEKMGNFRSQAPKFGNFQFTSLQNWKFSVHKPPNLEIFSSKAPLFRGNYQFTSPHFGNQGRTPLPNKSWVPPNIHWLNQKANNYLIIGLWKCTCAYRSANEHCVMKRLEDD